MQLLDRQQIPALTKKIQFCSVSAVQFCSVSVQFCSGPDIQFAAGNPFDNPVVFHFANPKFDKMVSQWILEP